MLFSSNSFAARIGYQLEKKTNYTDFMEQFQQYRRLINDDNITSNLFSKNVFTSRLFETKTVKTAFDLVLTKCKECKVHCSFATKLFNTPSFPDVLSVYSACLEKVKTRLDFEYLLDMFTGNFYTLKKLRDIGPLLIKKFHLHPTRPTLGLVKLKKKRNWDFSVGPKQRQECPTCSKRVIDVANHRKRSKTC